MLLLVTSILWHFIGFFFFFFVICSDSEERELVLDYIIERKRMDDLAASIVDGRFKEQKVNIPKVSIFP